MLDLEALSFLKAVAELRHLINLIDQVQDKAGAVSPEDRTNIIGPQLNNLLIALGKVGARSALAPANRLQHKIADPNSLITYDDLGKAFIDIESRFGDHLVDIKLFVLNAQEAGLFVPADQLLGLGGQPVEGFSRAFSNASFEIEEAAKCVALARYTACVFHCMRAIECGIKALCKFLEIPDATKPAEKSWGIILGKIQAKIDEKWPPKSRVTNSQGAKLEAMYVTLDAIKNPWRNATMHVETIYAPHEALHIARCTGMFLLELMKHCDEDGIPPESSPAMVTVAHEATPVSEAGSQ
ncbi:hypothetical protein ACVWZZ_001178 [Bradyrhizobium sp. LM6.10]